MTRLSYWGTYQITKNAGFSESIYIQIFSPNIAWELNWLYYDFTPNGNSSLSIAVARKDYEGSAVLDILEPKIYTAYGNKTFPDNDSLDSFSCVELPLIVGDCLRFKLQGMDAGASIIIYLNAFLNRYAILDAEVFGGMVTIPDYTVLKPLQRISEVI